MVTEDAPFEFTPRNITKFVVKTTVQVKAAAFTRHAIADHTSAESTDTPVIVAGALVGLFVAEKAKPYTDLAVDKTADFIVAKREAYRAKKSAKKSENE